MLDERKQKILQAIINDYISTAEPIGSRTIARKYDLGVSPATIRNEMADLELLGYIEHLHTSSGRIPSGKGYRLYVDDLLAPVAITENEMQLIRNWYNAKVRSIEEIFQETTRIIARLTKNVSLVLAPQLSQAAFRYLQFLPLDEKRVIVVVMTDAGFAENRLMPIPQGATAEDLQRIAEVMNRYLAGQPLESIRPSVLRKIRENVVADASLLETALETVVKALAVEQKERLYMGGATQLFHQPEFRDVEKIQNLLQMLEEEQLLCDLLHSYCKEGISVTIGQENKYSGIKDCSVISATYRLDGQVIGTIAVLGPTRMEYGRIMTLLDFMHQNLEDLLKRYKL